MNELQKLIKKWDEQIALHRKVCEDPLIYTKEDRLKNSHYAQAICAVVADLKKLNIPVVSCSVVHCKKAPYDVYIGRPSKWGNPFTHIPDRKTLAKYVVKTREESIEAYRDYILNGEGKHLMNDLHELKGKVLGCWCKPKSCHGDILAELVAEYCY